MSIKKLVWYITYSILIVSFTFKIASIQTQYSSPTLLEYSDLQSSENESQEVEKLLESEYVLISCGVFMFHNQTVKLIFNHIIIAPPQVHISLHYPPPNIMS